MLQLPSASTVAVPSTVVPFGAYSVMVSPAVPLPVIAGLGLVVIESFMLPVSLVASCVSVAVRPVGALVSISALSKAVGPTLPATSVTLAVTVIVLPSAGAAKLVNTLPAEILAADKIIVCVLVPSLTVSVSPALALVGKVILTPTAPTSSVLLIKPSSFMSSVIVTIGAVGAMVSSVTGTVTGALTLPAGSVSLTIKLLRPWVR